MIRLVFPLLLGSLTTLGQAPSASPSGHQDEVVKRGDQVMGFSHNKVDHHFRLFADGGAIEAQANDERDLASRDAIRAHFAHITKMFRAGDFHLPMLIHQQDSPGASAMARLRDQIRYTFEETPSGGRIRIATRNPDALRAIQEFLRFQIQDHQTGDSTAAPQPLR